MSPWSEAQRVELAEAAGRSRDEAMRMSQLNHAFTVAGKLMEALTDLETVAADVDDDHLSAHVVRIRLPLIGTGNRLAVLRREVDAR